jgi:chromosomal replication initiation ATPase DnaA
MKSQQIIDYVAFAQECTASDITGFIRTQHIADCRAVAQYALRAQGWTWQRIGDKFNCHHARVIHNYNKVDNSKKLKKQAHEILAQIKTNTEL